MKTTLPFCELHLHIEGTFEPDLIFSIAHRNGLAPPAGSPQQLKARYAFSSLRSFLDLYYANMGVLLHRKDFADLTAAYLRRAAAAGVRRAEIFVDPQAHLARGVTAADVLGGLHDAITQAADEISAAIIVCVLRDESLASAHRMLDAVLAAEIPVLGIGLDSAEVGHPPSAFKEVFDRARESGLRCVAHAGEEGPSAYVWEALDVLGAERIDHGVRSLEDPALVRRLVADQIPLTVCPLSNVRLAVFEELPQLPLRRMLDLGLRITLNSDDPAYFGGYLEDCVQACESTFDLTPAELEQLAANSVRASFLTDAHKELLLRRNSEQDASS